MAELIQLDKAAALVGKSEVTVRRLIKAGKIPFEKAKTLTGFVYVVDPDALRGYYKLNPEEAETSAAEPARPQSGGVRVAVAGESGAAEEYWQKKSDRYEERYTAEVNAHAKTREELGVWRGRAEQSQAMLMKLLPAPGSVEVKQNSPVQAAEQKSDGSWIIATMVVLILIVLAAAGVAAALYLRG